MTIVSYGPNRRCTEETNKYAILPYSFLVIWKGGGKWTYSIISIHNNWLLVISNIFFDSIECLPKQLRSHLRTFKNHLNPEKYIGKASVYVRFDFLLSSQRINPIFLRAFILRPFACPFIHLPTVYILRPNGG